MAAIYKGPISDLSVDPGETVTAKAFREVGASAAEAFVVCYMDDGASGTAQTARTQGVFSGVTKSTAADCVAGEKMYLDTTGNVFTSVATGNILAGRALTAATTGATSFTLALGLL